MNVILFDGVCNFCNAAVNWVIKRDKKNIFKFASLQSAYGVKIIKTHSLSNQYLNTVVLVENDKVYLRSVAVLRILKTIGGIYSLACILMIVPTPILNFFYNIVAKYRYRWFGKKDSCMVPDVSLKEKFID